MKSWLATWFDLHVMTELDNFKFLDIFSVSEKHYCIFYDILLKSFVRNMVIETFIVKNFEHWWNKDNI